MIKPRSVSCGPNRNGITLLEVLIAMFVMAVGILSIFGLFAAGREMESRALLLQRAAAYADGPGLAQVNNWMSVGQWLHYEAGSWQWVHSDETSNAATFRVRLPLVIDPISLSAEESGTSTSGTSTWGWNNLAPAQPYSLGGGINAFALKRISLPRTNRSAVPENPTDNLPFSRQEVFENAGDVDDVRFDVDQDTPDNPPKNAFALGRRARNSDLVPALFLANNSSASLGDIQPGPVSRWILIHYKPTTGYETFSNSNEQWPAGSVRFRVNAVTVSATTSGTTPLTPHSVLSLSLAEVLNASNNPETPKFEDDTAVRRSMKPGRWLLFCQQTAANSGQYKAEWVKISNVTPRPVPAPESWLVLLEDQSLLNGWIPNQTFCVAFESIIHVKQLLPDAPLSVP